MFTQSMPFLSQVLQGNASPQMARQLMQVFGNCNQPLEHRGPISISPSTQWRQTSPGVYGGLPYGAGSAGLAGNGWGQPWQPSFVNQFIDASSVFNQGAFVDFPSSGFTGDNFLFNSNVGFTTNNFPVTVVIGQNGEAGAAGAAGASGAAGLSGLNGVDGAPGIAGQPGLAGAAGAVGQRGADGLAGRDGLDGRPGAVGAAGAAGGAGSSGPPGAPGFDGFDGRPGQPGAPGRDGQTRVVQTTVTINRTIPGAPGKDAKVSSKDIEIVTGVSCVDGEIVPEKSTITVAVPA